MVSVHHIIMINGTFTSVPVHSFQSFYSFHHLVAEPEDSRCSSITYKLQERYSP